MLVVAGAVLAFAGAALASEAPAAADQVMQDVESSMIKEVGYDAATQIMTIKFEKNDATYQYKGVSEDVYKALMAAESKGKYFLENIKGKFETVKVEQ
jgi:hypothetical protein